jgi:anaerobic selenocysteine-containing dehydrogenase
MGAAPAESQIALRQRRLPSALTDVVFVNADDLSAAGLAHGDVVDVIAVPGRALIGQVAVAHAIARGSVAAYYPEANHLVPLDDYDRLSGTPAYKSIPVSLHRSTRGQGCVAVADVHPTETAELIRVTDAGE